MVEFYSSNDVVLAQVDKNIADFLEMSSESEYMKSTCKGLVGYLFVYSDMALDRLHYRLAQYFKQIASTIIFDNINTFCTQIRCKFESINQGCIYFENIINSWNTSDYSTTDKIKAVFEEELIKFHIIIALRKAAQVRARTFLMCWHAMNKPWPRDIVGIIYREIYRDF